MRKCRLVGGDGHCIISGFGPRRSRWFSGRGIGRSLDPEMPESFGGCCRPVGTVAGRDQSTFCVDLFSSTLSTRAVDQFPDAHVLAPSSHGSGDQRTRATCGRSTGGSVNDRSTMGADQGRFSPRASASGAVCGGSNPPEGATGVRSDQRKLPAPRRAMTVGR